LGKAKDNNASASIGPFVRLLDEGFTLDHVAGWSCRCVEHPDGFRMEGRSSMGEISRDPLDLARQACGRHHQYPDGFMLYCGTLFAPGGGPGRAGAGASRTTWATS
jgi:fumarylacetoacetate (FAA) hydrolase family protein